jgi:ATP-dependent helicase/nuclease subunit A
MRVGRTDPGDGQLVGLRRLTLPTECRDQDSIAAFEADLIARTIRHAVDQGRTLPRTLEETARDVGGAAQARDFLIVARQRARLSQYADGLLRWGIPHQVTGGTALNEIPELALLHQVLETLLRPDDPVALVAVLRSELFGVSDAALYEFRRLGGRFAYQSELPAELAGPDRAAIGAAFARLRDYSRWLARLPAIERIAAELGLVLPACQAARDGTPAGGLLKAIELLREAHADFWTAADLVEYLGTLVKPSDGTDSRRVDLEKLDGIPLRPHREPAVRIMNLHQVKGLEAPVVFLVDPSGAREHEVEMHIDRRGEQARGYLAVRGAARGYQLGPIVAQPVGWADFAAEEQQFQQAEERRLDYVAATRAGAMLSVTERAGSNTQNPWQRLTERLSDVSPALERPEIEPPDSPAATLTVQEVQLARERRASRRRQVLQPTYATVTAKRLGLHGNPPPGLPGEDGAAWGTVIHRLLETAMRLTHSDLHRVARSALAEQKLDPERAGEAVRVVEEVLRTAIWQRALASSQRLAEVPFETRLPAALVESATLDTIVRGVIDLVFWEPAGWVIVVYKTDAAATASSGELAAYYAGQLAVYAACWQEMTGADVHEQGLLFTRTGEYIRL